MKLSTNYFKCTLRIIIIASVIFGGGIQKAHSQTNSNKIKPKSFFDKGFEIIPVKAKNIAPMNGDEPFRDSNLSVEKRIDDLITRLTLDEKITLCYGDFTSGGIERLGISQLRGTDGPVGIRLMTGHPRYPREEKVDRTTALPSTLSLAATFNRKTAYDYYALIGREMLFLNYNVIFGPGVNMMRDPRGGRNYEYLGEDPYLTGEMAVNMVKGIQDLNVAADLKHFLANDHDQRRHFSTSKVDERTLREIYAYSFERAIFHANAWTMMTGNNAVNGIHCGHNASILNDLLRKQWHYDGVVITDWRSAYSTKRSALAGIDITTGKSCDVYRNPEFKRIYESGELPMSNLDEKVRNILRLYYRTGIVNPDILAEGENNSFFHKTEARRFAAEGMVLLKNENNLLPQKNPKCVYIVGAHAKETITGSGSGNVNGGKGNTTPFDGLVKTYGESVVKFVDDIEKTNFGNADLVVYVGATQPCGEGYDLLDIAADSISLAEINQLSSCTNKLLVVLQNGSAVDLASWHNIPQAILVSWYAGQACGEAIGDIVCGRVNPSGKLPCTFAALTDYPCERLGTWPARKLDEFIETEEYPFNTTLKYEMEYKEGVFIGYRWFDTQKIAPTYPFGFGLSYTDFTVSKKSFNQTANGFTVSCTVKNTGNIAGAEVVQLYVSDSKCSQPRPIKELKGFEKVHLEPGEIKTVEIFIPTVDLAFYDIKSEKWKTEKGEYVFSVGTSSRDICYSTSVIVDEDLFFEHL
jgi:beta-glucosidase